jgi:hypothetical protein
MNGSSAYEARFAKVCSYIGAHLSEDFSIERLIEVPLPPAVLQLCRRQRLQMHPDDAA